MVHRPSDPLSLLPDKVQRPSLQIFCSLSRQVETPEHLAIDTVGNLAKQLESEYTYKQHMETQDRAQSYAKCETVPGKIPEQTVSYCDQVTVSTM